MRTYIIFFIIFFAFVSCIENKVSHKFVSSKEYNSYLTIEKDVWCKNCTNIDSINQSFIFKLEPDIKISRTDFEFLILRSGYIYKGEFKDTINLKNIKYCLDDNLMKLNTLAFVLLDKKESLVYKWYRKQSFYLYDKTEIKISLRKNGDYKIKFN